MTVLSPTQPMPPVGRNVAIAGGVLAIHAAVIWAMQAAMPRQDPEIVTPVQVIESELITAPVLQVPPAPPPTSPPPPRAPTPPKPAPAPPIPKRAAPSPAPRPVAIADPTPAPDAPAGSLAPADPAPPAPPAPAAPTSPPPAPPAPPAPPRIEMPSSSADYLQNPKPAYPPMSKRLGEQGTVVVRVVISAEGLPQQVTVQRSSGSERLDRAAVDSVSRWKFVPGKRNGVPETMAYNVPVNFVLE